MENSELNMFLIAGSIIITWKKNLNNYSYTMTLRKSDKLSLFLTLKSNRKKIIFRIVWKKFIITLPVTIKKNAW